MKDYKAEVVEQRNNSENSQLGEDTSIYFHQYGNLDKLKVRMCVTGDLQKKLTRDMDDPHSPDAAYRMLRMFIGLAAQKNSTIHEGDVIGAFLKPKFIAMY